MAITVRKVTLWRRHVDNRPGALVQVLEPLAGAGADLQIAMGYRIPGLESRAVLELAPVTGKAAFAAARQAGLAPSDIPTLVVEGDDAPGLGLAQSRALEEAGINVAFLIAQVLGRRFSAVYGFDSEKDAERAGKLLKRAAPSRRRAAPRRKPARGPAAARSRRR
jgi:hypothetical protein